MEKELDVLIVSSRLENRKALLRILEELPVETFSVSLSVKLLKYSHHTHLQLSFVKRTFQTVHIGNCLRRYLLHDT